MPGKKAKLSESLKNAPSGRGIKFEGIDWTELCKPFNIKEDYSDKIIARRIKKYLSSENTTAEGCARTGEILRKFLKALVKNSDWSYSKPVYQGLLRIKNERWGNECLISWVIEILECLWN